MLVVDSIRMAGAVCSLIIVGMPSLGRTAVPEEASVFGLKRPSWFAVNGVVVDSESGDWTIGNRNSDSALLGDLIGRCEPTALCALGNVEDREVAGGVSEADVELNKGELMCLGEAGQVRNSVSVAIERLTRVRSCQSQSSSARDNLETRGARMAAAGPLRLG